MLDFSDLVVFHSRDADSGDHDASPAPLLTEYFKARLNLKLQEKLGFNIRRCVQPGAALYQARGNSVFVRRLAVLLKLGLAVVH